ncbi:hypothetical protein D9M71_638570 [compost metagenome]
MQRLFVRRCLLQRRQCPGAVIELWQQLLQGPARAQHLEEHLRLHFHQRALDFLPAALGSECLQFARGTDLAHQRQGFIGNPEPQWCVTGSKACNTQHAQRIFGECRGNMA